MCLRPITLPNPFYEGKFVDAERKFKNGIELSEAEHRVLGSFQNFHNRSITHIQVPCGECAECRLKRSDEFVQRCSMESIDSHVYMFTLTYNDKHLPIYMIEPKEGDDVLSISYARFEDVTEMFKRIRTASVRAAESDEHTELFPQDAPLRKTSLKAVSRLRYCVVSERGSLRHRPHFHGLIFIPKSIAGLPVDAYDAEAVLTEYLKTYFSVNVGTRKNPKYDTRFTYVEKYIGGVLNKTMDVHYIVPDEVSGVDKAIYYVGKYLTKEDHYTDQLKREIKEYCAVNEYPFATIWNVVKPKVRCSLYFGYGGYHNCVKINDHLFNCVKRSMDTRQNCALFYPVSSGKQRPMCHYFVHNTSILHNRDFLANSSIVKALSDAGKEEYFSLADRYDFYFRKNTLYIDNFFDEDEHGVKPYEYGPHCYYIMERFSKITEPQAHLD